MRIHDLRCTECEAIERAVWIDDEAQGYGNCAECGGARDWVPFVPHLDSYSTPKYDDGLGKFVSSTREREQIARANGLTPCGDKVGGARADLSLTGSLMFDQSRKRARA